MTKQPATRMYRGFTLDPFQAQAVDFIDENKSVLVAAPTGVGKTLIADYIIEKIFSEGGRVVYTAPIKALSNQKYREFKALVGTEAMGILTGDVVINPDAPILIMTTEIFRNMLQEDPERVRDVRYVIFDEVHYIDDPERGSVWEESLIFMPSSMRFLGLSATIPNVDELASWIEEVQDSTVEVVTHSERVVPLKHSLYERSMGFTTMRSVQKKHRKLVADSFDGRPEVQTTTHLDLVNAIKDTYLPCLFFTFSRRKCESNALALGEAQDFLGKTQKAEVQAIIESVLERYPNIESGRWPHLRRLLLKGIAYHHAGMLPVLKDIVEELFTHRLISVLYCTETFAVGLNFPCKTVCFDSSTKWDGVSFRPISNREYFQMAGRAGRRGIDEEGFVFTIVDLNYFDISQFPSMKEDEVEPLKSQFALTYNSILNLVKNYNEQDIHRILGQNFATYQARIDKKHFERQLAREAQQLNQLSSGLCMERENPQCPIVYYKLRQKLKKKQRRSRFIKGRARTAISAEINELMKYLQDIKPAACLPARQKSCESQILEWAELNNRVSSLQERTARIITSGRFNSDLQLKTEILEDLDYIREGRLLPRGEFAAQIYTQELLVTELYFNGIFHELDRDQLNALIVAIDYEPRKGEFYPKNLPFDVKPVKTIIRNLIYRYGVDERDAGFHPSISNLAYLWSKGSSFPDLLKEAGGIQEGDIVQAFRRGIDVMRQIKAACAGQDLILSAKLKECMDLMDRDLITVNL